MSQFESIIGPWKQNFSFGNNTGRL